MKTSTTAVINEFKTAYTVQTSVRCIAEWNMNRYSPIASIKNGTGAWDEYDEESFPISSIADPVRPETRGIVKGKAADVRIRDIGADSYAVGPYRDGMKQARYLTVSPDSKYKYWTSPVESAGSKGSLPGPQNISYVQPTIIYTSLTWCNKIRIVMEDSTSSPAEMNVQITTNGTTWTTVMTNPASRDGLSELYRQPDGSWGYTESRNNPMKIKGIRLNVTKMDEPMVGFNLIELSPRLESDLTPFLISYDSNEEMSESSFITPLGQASSNTASVKLSNVDSRFSGDNPDSLYYGLIDKNVDIRLDLGITTDPYTSPSKTYSWIRQFTMKVDTWEGKDWDVVTAQLKDDSTILQSIKPNPTVYENCTVAQIIWRLLDGIGFNRYKVDMSDIDAATLVPYFWATGEETIWEIIAKLCQATQTACYFDEYNVLQIKTRNAALNLTAPVSWTFESRSSGGRLADIRELDKTEEYEANVVSIAYKSVKPSDTLSSGLIPMETIWEPDGDVVLRASGLANTISSTQNYLQIAVAHAPAWPYTGHVQIEGEIIKYEGKGYSYFDSKGVAKGAWIKSEDERVALDKLNPTLSFKNSFTGYLLLTQRGAMGTVKKAHYADVASYQTKIKNGAANSYKWAGGWGVVRGGSSARILTNATFKSNSFYTITRGADTDAVKNYFGTRFKFLSTSAVGMLGLCINAVGAQDAGYYIEIFKTKNFEKYPSNRSQTNEIALYVKTANGATKRLGSNGGKGVPAAFADNVWYDLDVTVTYAGDGVTPTISIFVNGINFMNVTIPAANRLPASGRFGIFTRGYTNAEFEYLYAASKIELAPNVDGSSVFDRIKGGYTSNQLDTEWIYNTRQKYVGIVNKQKKYVTKKYNELMIDEFGPIVHEVREYDVKFDVSGDKGPAMHSRIYSSNDYQVVIPDYNGNPFGAKFTIANASRVNAVLNGDDAITYGVDNTIRQALMIYGRPLKIGEESTVEVRDENAIRRRGEVQVDFPSDWIQSKAAADKLGSWIVSHWAGGQDEVVIQSFANPLLSLGDLVAVNSLDGFMKATTHKYFVSSIQQSYSEGLETTFTLRRAKV